MLEKYLQEYINNPRDGDICFALGYEYEKLGQTASAAGYYLRATEFGNNTKLAYEALCRMALCFERQGNRWFMIKGLLQRAISLFPHRPEAHFLLSRAFERCKDWQEGYTQAIIGKELSTEKPDSITYLEYDGLDTFDFQKGVSAWWIGLFDESLDIMRKIKNNTDLPQMFKQAAINNLANLDNNWKEPNVYDKNRFKDLIFKFDGSHSIDKNYSQTFQDMFVLMALNGKREGIWLEIGCADPIYGNNTYLLETQFGWNGISIDYNPESIAKWNIRKAEAMHANALNINYKQIESKIIDYLQIDIDPPENSYRVLQKIPFWTHKFRVITFEHDYYADNSKLIRDKSRKYLKSFGYELIVGDVGFDDYCSYEDWWVHPDLVDRNIIEILKSNSDSIKNAEKYIYNEL